MSCQDDGSFEIVCCEPASGLAEVQEAVDAAIMDGAIAWALNRNQAVLLPTVCGRTLLLQAIATRSRIHGMFVGLLSDQVATIEAPSLNALSIVLYASAYAIESTTLRSLLRTHMAGLEQRVQDVLRTGGGHRAGRGGQSRQERTLANTATRSDADECGDRYERAAAR